MKMNHDTTSKLNALILLSKELESTLLSEQEALTSSNLDDLESYIELKSQLVDRIQTLTDRDFVESHTIHSEDSLFTELRETLSHCQTINNDNASINRLRQQEIRQLINVLQQDGISGSVYTQTGAISSPSNTNYGIT